MLPRRVFARRTDEQLADPGGPSYERAAEALPDGGSVLDVGAGTGAASLPLAVRPRGRAGSVVAVDTEASMLDTLAERARDLGVEVHSFVGRWPDVAGEVPAADVVVCHNVLYNVPDIEPFVRALTTHARRRVVVQLTARHPLTALNSLWEHFHGLRRPERPTAADAVSLLRALDLRPYDETWTYSQGQSYDSFDDLVDVTRRRLCLPPERAGELADALRDLGIDPAAPRDLGPVTREAVTVWWDGTAPARD